MEQLIEAFGIDVRLITVQIINFAILLGLLSYFLYKPVLKLLAERQESIEKGIADAEAAAAAKHNAESEKAAVLKAAHLAAEEVSNRATVHAKEAAAAVEAAAEEKAAYTLSEAEKKAAQLKAAAEKEAEAEIAKVAILAAEKILQTKNS